MRIDTRFASLSLICLAFVVSMSAASWADDTHDRTQFGHNITVNAGEQVTEVTCFGCSVHVRGHVAGDVTTFAGNVIVEDGGEIDSDLTTFGGEVRLDKGSQVGAGVTVFGGRLRRDPEAQIEGDVTTFNGTYWLFLIFGLPVAVLAGLVFLVVWIVRRLTRAGVPVTA
jgi:hypothetical protein